MQTNYQFKVKTWVLYNSIGWITGIVLIFAFAILGDVFASENNKGGQAIIGLGLGAGVGLMQRLYLKKVFGFSSAWFWFSFLSFGLIYILYDLSGFFIVLKPETYLPFFTLFSALCCGYLQNAVIKKKFHITTLTWPLVNGAVWFFIHLLTGGLFLMNVNLDAYLPRFFLLPLAFIFLFIGGPILGLLTSFYWKRLMQQ